MISSANETSISPFYSIHSACRKENNDDCRALKSLYRDQTISSIHLRFKSKPRKGRNSFSHSFCFVLFLLCFYIKSCEVTPSQGYSLYSFPWVILKRSQNVSNHLLYVLVASLWLKDCLTNMCLNEELAMLVVFKKSAGIWNIRQREILLVNRSIIDVKTSFEKVSFNSNCSLACSFPVPEKAIWGSRWTRSV